VLHLFLQERWQFETKLSGISTKQFFSSSLFGRVSFTVAPILWQSHSGFSSVYE